MHKCFRCKNDRSIDQFHPNISEKSWCKECINKLRAKRPGIKRHKVEKLEREQAAILELIKQFQTNKEAYVYLLESGGRYKIGYSNNIFNRAKTFNTASPIPHKIVAVAPGGKQLEGNLHNKLERFRTFGEWFAKDESILEEFKTLDNVMIFLPGYITEEAPSQPCVDGQLKIS